MNWEEMRKRMDANCKKMQDKDVAAKVRGDIVGRYISHPFADGYAYYEIIRENKKTVRIEVVTGIGDDWVLPAWGEATSIKKDDAMDFLARRDMMAEIFGT